MSVHLGSPAHVAPLYIESLARITNRNTLKKARVINLIRSSTLPPFKKITKVMVSALVTIITSAKIKKGADKTRMSRLLTPFAYCL